MMSLDIESQLRLCEVIAESYLSDKLYYRVRCDDMKIHKEDDAIFVFNLLYCRLYCSSFIKYTMMAYSAHTR